MRHLANQARRRHNRPRADWRPVHKRHARSGFLGRLFPSITLPTLVAPLAPPPPGVKPGGMEHFPVITPNVVNMGLEHFPVITNDVDPPR